MSILDSCTPQKVFAFFEEIAAIPHGSYHEEKIADYIVAFAKERSLAVHRDAMHNVLIRKPASEGYADAPVVMLQGHMDMVCEKNTDSKHDFEKDGLKLILENGMLRADGTTLGADDGIAVAMMLAVLDDPYIPHPELECLFTAQEEVGLNGADAFDYSSCRAELLFNLDSEDEGIATVSCAGGVRCDIEMPVSRAAMPDSDCYMITADGFAGGHSGMDINCGRMNAIRTVVCLLMHLLEDFPLRLVSITGGAKDNAIARTCRAVVAVPHELQSSFHTAFERLAAERRTSFSKDDSNATLTVEPCEVTKLPMTQLETAHAVAMTVLLPNGVLRTSQQVPGLVETSANLGVIETTETVLRLTSSARSSSNERKNDIMSVYRLLAQQFGAKADFRGDYPGWEYQEQSRSRTRYQTAYRALYGEEPKIEAIHAGLECGIIQSRMPSLDPISIGPDMKGVHTPQETLDTASVSRLYQTLLLMLRLRED